VLLLFCCWIFVGFAGAFGTHFKKTTLGATTLHHSELKNSNHTIQKFKQRTRAALWSS
jgi:hypothetical protein